MCKNNHIQHTSYTDGLVLQVRSVMYGWVNFCSFRSIPLWFPSLLLSQEPTWVSHTSVGVSSFQAGSCSEPLWAWTPAYPSGSAPGCYPHPLVPAASSPPAAPGCSSPLEVQGSPWQTTPGGSPPLPPQTQRGRSHKGRRYVPLSRVQATWWHTVWAPMYSET